MSKLLDECEVFENTLYFLALTAERQAEIRALPSEEAKRARGAELLAEVAEYPESEQ